MLDTAPEIHKLEEERLSLSHILSVCSPWAAKSMAEDHKGAKLLNSRQPGRRAGISVREEGASDSM